PPSEHGPGLRLGLPPLQPGHECLLPVLVDLQFVPCLSPYEVLLSSLRRGSFGVARSKSSSCLPCSSCIRAHISYWRPAAIFKKVSEQRAIMNHCLSEFLRSYWFTSVSGRDIVSDPVVLNHDGMIHGDIRHSLLEITDWIATRSHYITDQTI